MVTNALPIALAPATTAAATATAGGTTVTMTCAPLIRAGQTVAILLAQEMELVETPETATDTAEAEFAGFTPGQAVPVRLRVNGIDSPVIDMTAKPPTLITVTVP
jgi:hypothetical protein